MSNVIVLDLATGTKDLPFPSHARGAPLIENDELLISLYPKFCDPAAVNFILSSLSIIQVCVCASGLQEAWSPVCIETWISLRHDLTARDTPYQLVACQTLPAI